MVVLPTLLHTGDITLDYRMSIELLSLDYLSTAGSKYNSGVSSTRVEAPALFYRNGLYYASFGSLCCFCGEGKLVTFFVAESP